MEKLAEKQPAGEKTGRLLPCCRLCGNVPAGGIAGGYRINKSFICYDCETKLVTLTAGSAAYDEYLMRLREFWSKRK